ncbi:diacylglycerol kinase [Nocardioides taihuensis]|uniref:Diacylglycerol kinase n=1 Tax=Nocardioides taihuensis TaxID=1835606 RepID=A0ABW0BFR9_9ACTN
MRNKFTGVGGTRYRPVRKVKVVFSGLRFAVRHDFAVAYKLVVSVVLVAGAAALQQWVDFVVILLATGLVLTAELLNSALEALCDHVETGHHEQIGIVKDVAAAAVGISIIVWVATITFECVRLVSVL